MTHPDVERLHETAVQLFHIMTVEDLKAIFGGPTTPRILRFLDLMRQVLRIDPDERRALSNMASLGAKLGFPAEARDAAERLVVVEPSANSFMFLGQALLNAGEYDAAVAAFESALSFGATFGIWLNIAAAQVNCERLQEALSCVDTALRLAEPREDISEALALRDEVLKMLNRIHGGADE